jgi:hypothetical protein
MEDEPEPFTRHSTGVLATLRAPMKGFTKEQEEVWELVGRGRRPVEPSGDQGPEQALNFAVSSLRNVCYFEGVELPSDAAIREALERLPGRGGGSASKSERDQRTRHR